MLSMQKMEMLRVAALRAGGYTELYIARVLGISTTTVSNRLKQAEAEKYLLRQEPYILNRQVLTAEQDAELENTVKRSSLQEKLNRAISRYSESKSRSAPHPEAVVVPSGSERVDPEGWKQRLKRFGLEAAPTIRAAIAEAKGNNAGIAWGATVASVVDEIEKLDRGNRLRPPVTFVPVCGEPLDTPLSRESASQLCSRLDTAINLTHGHALSLAALPALTPIEFASDSEKATLLRLYRRVKHYDKIFGNSGNSTGLIDKLSVIVCSVGPEDRVWGYRSDDLLRSGGLKREELNKLVSGDVAGVLVPKAGQWADERLSMIRDRHWNGLLLRSLVETVERAKAKTYPGVCVLALGKNKSDFVFRCLGLCNDQNEHVYVLNRLVVDDDLAQALLVRLVTANKLGESKKTP